MMSMEGTYNCGKKQTSRTSGGSLSFAIKYSCSLMTDSVDVFFVDRHGIGFGGVVLVESSGWWGRPGNHSGWELGGEV